MSGDIVIPLRFHSDFNNIPMSINLQDRVKFSSRHNGPTPVQIEEMIKEIGVESVDQLIDQAIPKGIQKNKKLNLPEALNEFEYLNRSRVLHLLLFI